MGPPPWRTWLLAGALVAWSVVANLVIGERAYTSRNLLLTALLLGGWWWHRTRGRDPAGDRDTVLTELGLSARQLGAGLRWGGAAFVIVAGAIGIGVVLADVVAPIGALLSDQRAAGFADDVWFVALVRIPLGTAVFEEVAFRGVLLAAAMRWLSTWRAVGLSSVAFGLWHIAPTMVALDLNQIAVGSVEGVAAIAGAVVVTTVAGVAFCWLRIRSGSLLAPILAHVATNSVSLVAAVAVQGLL